MYRNLAYIVGLLILVSFSSCKKYLDKTPNDQFAYANTLREMQALLDNPIYINNQKTPSISEASTDDYYFSEKGYSTLPLDYTKIYKWDYPRFSDGSINDWYLNYVPVYIANICLDNIGKVERTPDNSIEWDNVKGSALFIRAYYFLQLVWAYSKAYEDMVSDRDLGIVLVTSSDARKKPTRRASVTESYERIVKDCKEALYLLAANSAHVLRPSKAAANALLARTYLSMGKYDSAWKYANNCLILKSDLIDFNGDVEIASPFTSENPAFRKYNKEIIFYTETSNTLQLYNYGGSIDTVLLSSYASEDLRKVAFFKESGLVTYFKGSYAQDRYILFSGLATDEMYLIRAECFLRKNMKEDALKDLYTLLKKRWKTGYAVNYSSKSYDELLQIILEERRKELVMRNIRWSDIKRLNKEGKNIILKRLTQNQYFILSPNDNRFALHIPDDVIELSGIEQNPR